MGWDGEWQQAPDEYGCPKCREKGCVEYRCWESDCGGYDDYKHRCTKCGNTWWVDGPDA